jgi:hypothetical protein
MAMSLSGRTPGLFPVYSHGAAMLVSDDPLPCLTVDWTRVPICVISEFPRLQIFQGTRILRTSSLGEDRSTMPDRKRSSRSVAQDAGPALVSIGHAQRLRGMCNHGLISEEQAQEVIDRIRAGSQSVETAIEELQESCTCGLFLPSRARRILNSACTCGD